MSEQKNWQDDPSLKGLNSDKLQFLTKMMGEMNGKDTNSMLPFLMGLSSSSEGKSMGFSDSETDLILQVLKQRMSPEEQSKIEMLRNLSRMIAQKGQQK